MAGNTSSSPYADVRSERASGAGGSQNGQGGKGHGKGPIVAIVVIVLLAIIAAAVIVPRISGGSSSAGTQAATSTAQQAPSDADGDSAELVTVHLKVDATEHGDGVVFDSDVQVPGGATVEEVMQASGLEIVDKSTLGMGSYISSINGIKEKDIKSTSGWIFSVNGTKSSVSCNRVTVTAGDQIEWNWRLDGTSADS